MVISWRPAPYIQRKFTSAGGEIFTILVISKVPMASTDFAKLVNHKILWISAWFPYLPPYPHTLTVTDVGTATFTKASKSSVYLQEAEHLVHHCLLKTSLCKCTTSTVYENTYTDTRRGSAHMAWCTQDRSVLPPRAPSRSEKNSFH